jgi:hypothetical protein
VKILFTSLFLTIIFQSFANEEKFSNYENQLILQAVDNACGDSWCEGPYMYEFLQFNCLIEKNICQINFRATEDQQSFLEGSCELSPAYKSLDDFIDNEIEGVWPTLKFYDFISECLSEWESTQN